MILLNNMLQYPYVPDVHGYVELNKCTPLLFLKQYYYQGLEWYQFLMFNDFNAFI